MTDATFAALDVAPFDHGPLSRRHSTLTIAGAGAVTLGVLAGAWLLDHHAPRNPFGLQPEAARLATAFRAAPAAPLPDLSRTVPPASEKSVDAPPPAEAAVPALAVESPRGLSLLDPGFARGPAAASLADSAPLAPRFVSAEPAPPAVALAAPIPAFAAPAPEELHDAAPTLPRDLVLADLRPQIETVPLPTPRPAFPWEARDGGRGGRRQMARFEAPAPAAPGPAAPAAPADDRGFLEKFFGAFKPSGSALGYAAPEDGLFGRSGLPSGPAMPRDRYTAVYDISAHTVYLPDGTRLEAHSGLGRMMDDPRSVMVRNTGATPPHVYDLTLREAPFHGVQALRLTPVGGGNVHGRDGLLAHTYMLGPSGQSNGCVSFRDYASFLRAYQNGQIRRLAVVAGGMT